MKENKKWMALGCSLVMMAAALTGCGENGGDTAATEAPKQELSGSLSMAGSTSMEKLANALSEGFMAENRGVTVTAEFVGSSAGIESLLKGSCDIGNASRELKESETSAGAVENVVAIDGIAVIANKEENVTGISKDKLKKIYTGELKNWSEVGGKDAAIVVVGREAGSGTRDAFEELLELKDQCAYANELDSTGAVLAKVASTPGAIGYVSLDVLDDTVTALKLDDVTPTEENIKAGTYFLSRPFVMATKGDIVQQNELVQAWFDYINSPAGQEMIAKVGLISAK